MEARFHPAYYAGGVESIFELDPEARGRMEEKIRRLFDLPETGGPHTTIALQGKASPPATIINYITEAAIDLVILSNNGYDEVEDYVVGSTTERVIRRSTVPSSWFELLHQRSPQRQHPAGVGLMIVSEQVQQAVEVQDGQFVLERDPVRPRVFGRHFRRDKDVPR